MTHRPPWSIRHNLLVVDADGWGVLCLLSANAEARAAIGRLVIAAETTRNALAALVQSVERLNADADATGVEQFVPDCNESLPDCQGSTCRALRIAREVLAQQTAPAPAQS